MSNDTQTPEKNTSPDLELLGQKFYLPNSNVKLLGFIAFLIAATLIAFYIVKYGYYVEKSSDGWTFKSGHIVKGQQLNNGFIMNFWTPSDETCSSFTKEDKTERAWQCKKDESYEIKNQKFGEKLVNKFDFDGYRFMPVVGYGKQKKFKKGLLWTIGVTNRKCDDHFLETFKQTYIEFWSPGAKWDNLYVEIIGSK